MVRLADEACWARTGSATAAIARRIWADMIALAFYSISPHEPYNTYSGERISGRQPLSGRHRSRPLRRAVTRMLRVYGRQLGQRDGAVGRIGNDKSAACRRLLLELRCAGPY